MTLAKELLKQRGIDDAATYLDSLKGRERIGFVDSAEDIQVRGSVHLMLRRIIRRDDVDRRLTALRHL